MLSPFVLFGGPNLISAEVPTGATTGPMGVTTSEGSATSAQSFVVAVGATGVTVRVQQPRG